MPSHKAAALDSLNMMLVTLNNLPLSLEKASLSGLAEYARDEVALIQEVKRERKRKEKV